MKRYIRNSTANSIIPKHIYEIRMLGEDNRKCYGFLKKPLNTCYLFDITFNNSDIYPYMLYPEDFSILKDLGKYTSLTQFLHEL